MADHCIDHNHTFDVKNVKVIHSETKYRKLIALETLEIYKHKKLDNIVNIQIPTPSPLLKPKMSTNTS